MSVGVMQKKLRRGWGIRGEKGDGKGDGEGRIKRIGRRRERGKSQTPETDYLSVYLPELAKLPSLSPVKFLPSTHSSLCRSALYLTNTLTMTVARH